MHDTAKYLVHADITADGIVERSDVVGAVFGQTEGLLGDELDLRELQDASKVGRIDVEIDSRNGQSFGHVTIATSLDQVETAILAAALETIDRVGPCRATIDVDRIEDVRAAKRRQVVERAKTLLGEAFDESVRSSHDLVEEVREAVRVEDITDYDGFPAGPNVADSDAIIVVEGRADVLTLLRYGVKNAVAVEGTNVPDAIAELTDSRTVTAFLDGDRGGDLILKELAQVGDVDYVAIAPAGLSVEDLDRHEVITALRDKVPYETFDTEEPGIAAADGTEIGADGADGAQRVEKAEAAAGVEEDSATTESATAGDPIGDDTRGDDTTAETTDDTTAETTDDTTAETTDDTVEASSETAESGAADDESPSTLRGHVRTVVGDPTGRVRLLDDEFDVLDEDDADAAFDLVADADTVPSAVVLDGELDQRVLDVAAQRGVDQIVAAATGEFVKQPTSVRVRTADELLATNEA